MSVSASLLPTDQEETASNMLISRLNEALTKHGVKFCIVGGVAVSLHGAVRGTLDVDIVIPMSLQQYQSAEIALTSIGLSGRLPVDAESVFNSREDWITNRNLIAWSFMNPDNPIELVDVLITEDFDRMEKVEKDVAGDKMHVISIDALIEMKIASGRKQDLADVEALERLR